MWRPLHGGDVHSQSACLLCKCICIKNKILMLSLIIVKCALVHNVLCNCPGTVLQVDWKEQLLEEFSKSMHMQTYELQKQSVQDQQENWKKVSLLNPLNEG